MPVWLVVLVVSIVTYVLSFLLIRAISRYREYAADRGAALITGAPEHLMSALQKITGEMTRIPQRDLRQVEAMNAFFIVPTNIGQRVSELFATHPPTEKRLARLAEIAREMGRPVAYRLGLRDILFGRKQLKEASTRAALRALDGAGDARGRARPEGRPVRPRSASSRSRPASSCGPSDD